LIQKQNNAVGKEEKHLFEENLKQQRVFSSNLRLPCHSTQEMPLSCLFEKKGKLSDQFVVIGRSRLEKKS